MLSVLLLLIFLITCVYLSLQSQTRSMAWLASLFPISISSSQLRHGRAAPPKKTDNGEIGRVFATLDRGKDGLITHNELKESLENLGLLVSEDGLWSMVQKLDANGDGGVDLDEFCVLYESMAAKSSLNKSTSTEEEDAGEELKEAFDVFDQNGDGFITSGELKSVLSSLGLDEGRNWGDCRDMIGKVDTDGDGQVNFEEFRKMMNHGVFVPSF